MDLRVNKQTLIVFDLDDTLYSEICFLKSAFREIAQFIKVENAYNQLIAWYNNKEDVFGNAIDYFGLKSTKEELITMYRQHYPQITLFPDAQKFIESLSELGIDMSIITDGRSITQRNKLKSLQIHDVMNRIVISEEIKSEKPGKANFETLINEKYNSYVYIADNPKKDFLMPNKLGWLSICMLAKDSNIHEQNFNIEIDFLPKFIINNFDEINLYNEH